MPSPGGNFLFQLQNRSGVVASILRWILAMAASIYSLISTFRQIGFDNGLLSCRKMGVPVIALGNITTGGTGKTPACLWLIRKLLSLRSPLPVLISRGYGNDEVVLFRDFLPETPHFIHPKRVVAGRKAIEKHGKNICLVLDDAYQHQYIYRDLNIVLLDATEPFGFGYPLPRGFLRETPSNLRRADFVILTKSDMVEKKQLEQIRSKILSYTNAPQALAVHAPCHVNRLGEKERYPLETLQNQKLLAFSGIGNPESFIQSLIKQKIRPLEQVVYSDHHQYTQEDKEKLLSRALNIQAQGFVTTAKDAVKIKDWQNCPIPLWIWQIEFRIVEGEEELAQKIAKIFTKF